LFVCLFVLTSFNGLTAYDGFFEVCKPKKGEKLFILHFLDRLETSLDSMPNYLVTMLLAALEATKKGHTHALLFDFVSNLK